MESYIIVVIKQFINLRGNKCNVITAVRQKVPWDDALLRHFPVDQFID